MDKKEKDLKHFFWHGGIGARQGKKNMQDIFF